MEDLKHQLVSPLRTAASRTESVLRIGRFDGRVEGQLKAVRGLCRKASRVAMSAGVFATLSRGDNRSANPSGSASTTWAAAHRRRDDDQVLGDPRRGIRFEVERESIRRMGRRLVNVDTSFLQQCVGNVLDNAAKYGYEGTGVSVGADVGPSSITWRSPVPASHCAPPSCPRVCSRNWRGDAARSTTGEGSGLGLWIVDHLMRAHGRSRVDRRVRRADHGSPGASARVSTDSRRKMPHFVVVEDDHLQESPLADHLAGMYPTPSSRRSPPRSSSALSCLR
jgi:signal transduction histidine kinase